MVSEHAAQPIGIGRVAAQQAVVSQPPQITTLRAVLLRGVAVRLRVARVIVGPHR